MAVIQREFYRSARGPSPRDEDWWTLVFDRVIGRLFIRHEWETSGHSGVDEFELVEFLEQDGAAQTALLDTLFRVRRMSERPKSGSPTASSKTSSRAKGGKVWGMV